MSQRSSPDVEGPAETTAASAIEIRKSRPEDRSFVQELTARLFLAYGSYDRYLREWFGRSDVHTYVAESAGRRVGFYMLQFPGGPEGGADLIAIAVEPEDQSRGVGGALLDACFELARERLRSRSSRKLRLSVADTNARAQRLFSRRGFRYSRDVGMYPAGQRARLMVKSLEEDVR